MWRWPNIRTGVTACACCSTVLLMAERSHADVDQAVQLAFDHFFQTCKPALEDLDAFLAGAAGDLPEGSFKSLLSEDENVYKFAISAGDGFLFDTYERWIMPTDGYESCATHYTGEDIPVGADTASAVNRYLLEAVGAENVFGGQFQEIYPVPGHGTDQLYINEDNYRFRVRGLLPDESLITELQVVSGFMSIWSSRDLPAQDP